MAEEFGFDGYTRQNFMVLNEDSLSQNLFNHELFHIISRFNPGIQHNAYRILGFKPCNVVTLQRKLNQRRITNPDAPLNNYFIEIKWGRKIEEAIMLLYSERPYTGGDPIDYFKRGLLLIEGNDFAKKVKETNGKFILLEYDEVTNLFDQIGPDARHKIHPEEISAAHFAEMLGHQWRMVDKLQNMFLEDQPRQAVKMD